MKNIIAAGFIVLTSVTFAQQSAHDPAEGARNVAAVLAASQLPATALQRQIQQDCRQLEKDIDDPALACAAVRCATGVSPTWSACPVNGERGEAVVSR